MLFIADWLLPIGPTQSVTSGEANKPTIRIKSDQDHKWPEGIAFDTSAPTMVVQMPPLVADAPVTNPQREAFALLSEGSEARPTLPVDGLSTGCKSRSVTRWLVVRVGVARIDQAVPVFRQLGHLRFSTQLSRAILNYALQSRNVPMSSRRQSRKNQKGPLFQLQ